MPEDVGPSRSGKMWILSALVVVPTDHPYTACAIISLIGPPFRRSRLLSRSKNVADKAEPVVVGLWARRAERSGSIWPATTRSACPACVGYPTVIVDGFIERRISERHPQSGALVPEKCDVR